MYKRGMVLDLLYLFQLNWTNGLLTLSLNKLSHSSRIQHVLDKTASSRYNAVHLLSLPSTYQRTVIVACFRRFFRYCLRFMTGYRAALEGPLLD